MFPPQSSSSERAGCSLKLSVLRPFCLFWGLKASVSPGTCIFSCFLGDVDPSVEGVGLWPLHVSVPVSAWLNLKYMQVHLWMLNVDLTAVTDLFTAAASLPVALHALCFCARCRNDVRNRKRCDGRVVFNRRKYISTLIPCLCVSHQSQLL